jgi:CHAT domain-containing protein
LFDPLLDAIGQCERIFLSPDGVLNRLPFEILPLDDGRRLIDAFTVSYLSAGRDAIRFDAGAGTPSGSLVVADPDFDLAAASGSSDAHVATTSAPRSANAQVAPPAGETLRASGVHFSRLPGTRVEGERIARLLGVTPLFGTDAVESAIKNVRSPLVLHIATHGFFLTDRPDEGAAAEPEGRLGGRIENPMLRSGLALAGANTWLDGGLLPSAAEDALLNGEDVSALDLISTELVVLSACDTGLGDVTAGEGVFGLRRAFVLAGARTLIMSLWKVPDQQTQELMAEFYDRILAGAPRAAALRAAQLAIKAVHPDPLYWGAFICQGDPGPVRPSAAR